MTRKPYPSDLTNTQWALIAPTIPAVKPGGRPRKYDMREVVNGILYVNREGCRWRALPHDLPHGKTAYNVFRAFAADGTWDRRVTARRVEVRTELGREPTPSGGCIDSPSVKTASGGAAVGVVFDEGYGSKVPFLGILSAVGQHFVGEIPVSFSVRTGGRDEPRRADQVLRAHDAKPGRRFRLSRQTVGDAWWRATSVLVTAGGCEWTRVAATNESTAEVKYLVTNATATPLSRVLAVAFRRATIEHRFRVAKSEPGLAH